VRLKDEFHRARGDPTHVPPSWLVGKGLNNYVTSLANQPATSQQRRLVVLVAALQVVAFGFAAPFAHIPLAQVNAFIPTLEGIIFVNDIITSIFLFAQYSIFPSRAILVLAAGYLFTALIVIPHALTFPGAFAPTGLLNCRPAEHILAL
jgi:hypothetical protein